MAIDEAAIVAEATTAAAKLSGISTAQARAFLSALRQCLKETQLRHMRDGRDNRGATNRGFNVQKFEKRK